MPITLSETALSLLRLHLAGKALILKGPNAEALSGCSMEETLAAYRELAAGGLMYPVSGYTHGPESLYRLSDEGWERRHEFLN